MIIGAGVPIIFSALSLLTCLTSKWILLLALRVMAKSVTGVVTLVAAILVLPDYWLSLSNRSRGRTPSPLTYAYGDAISLVASAVNKIVGWVLGHTTRTMREAPAPLVAVTTGLALLVWSASPLIR